MKKFYLIPGLILALLSASSLYPNTVYMKMDWGFGYWPDKEMETTFGSLGYKVKEVRSLAGLKDVSFIITYDVPRNQINELLRYPKEKRVLVLWEPPVIKPYNYDKRYHDLYGTIFTFDPTLVDNKKYFQCYYTVRKSMINDRLPFSERKFAVMINTNKSYDHPSEIFSERVATVDFFNRYAPNRLDVYGRGWGNFAQCNRGPLGGNHKWDDKIEVFKQYKFVICYENSVMPGYITEKIFDAFRAGCVPVYWGPKNIETSIPEGCYVRRDHFVTNQALYEFLSSMTEHDFNQYIDNIAQFLASPAAQRFTEQYFVDSLVNALIH